MLKQNWSVPQGQRWTSVIIGKLKEHRSPEEAFDLDVEFRGELVKEVVVPELPPREP